MTIKRTMAAIAAVSSSVLIFGQTTFAMGPMPIPMNAPPSFNPNFVMPQPPQLPQPQAPYFAPQTAPQVTAQPSQAQPASQPTTASTPNTYVKGTCTWYVKEKRPDLPNGLGNGGQWVGNAAKRGFKTGTTPQAGAVGEQPGHVVYIESVSSSTVTVSEMNYGGKKGVVHKRTVKASTFKYIY